MGGHLHRLGGLSTLLALAALAGCATPEEGPLVESGGAPIAGLSEGRSAASPARHSVGLLAVSGNAMLLGAPRSEVATIPGAPSLPLDMTPADAGAPGGTDTLDPTTAPTSGPVLALNARPAGLPAAAAAAGATLSPLAAGPQGLLAPPTSPRSLLSPVAVGVQSVLTPATATNPGAATTQLANALVSTISRVAGGVGGVVSPLLPATTPGGAGLGRLVSGLTPPAGN